MELIHLLLYLCVFFTFIETNYSDGFRTKTTTTQSSLSNDSEDKEIEDDKILKRNNKNPDWSTWSDWSPCSRTCDGGVSFQLRRCHSPQGCKGDSVRYKICNMQACPDQQDYRGQQCIAYDDIPYDGALFNWSPHYDYSEPCALTCRGRPEHLPDEKSHQDQQHHDDAEDMDMYGTEDEPSVIVQLSNRVQDGTRCRPGSLDMCIQGKCQRVGCDLRIGSTKKIDSCGVCGGDSTSCTQPLYHWNIAPMSMCSVSCGGGYKMAMPTCRNRNTGADVEVSLCNAASRPEPSVVQCNTHSCPPKWISDEWGPCSKVCGSGIKERLVVCAEESNGVKHRVPDEACRGVRPKIQEHCNVHECPRWELSEWSGCSSSCGTGMQVRSVECMDHHGHNTQCDPTLRPEPVQSCSTGISCTSDTTTITSDNSSPSHAHSDKTLNSGRGSFNEHLDEDVTEEDEELQPQKPVKKVKMERPSDEEDDEEVEDDDEDLNMQGDAPENLQRNTPLAYQYRIPRAERLVDPNAPNEPTFIPGEWSTCSVSCGEGVRRRKYQCKIFLEFSKVIAAIDDSKCHVSKPADDFERCIMEPCSYAYGGYDENYRSNNRQNNDQIKVQAAVPGKTYSWRDEGYTSCSASCLGGVEELIINCVRDDTGKVSSPYLCSPETKPENRIRTCNDIPCPPRWNYSDYSPCTKSCGIGIKTREITCIHEVTRGGENTMIVPNSMCPSPTPPDRQYCNVLDCPARWEFGEWSRCTKSCGGGYKNRTVLCKQTMAQDHKVGRLDSSCPGIKPPDKKACNSKPCAPEDDRPPISLNESKYIQHDPKMTKITLKVGGAATVFYGAQVKIKCPVKKYNRTKIKWSKDHHFLPKIRKYKVSKKGALRVLDVTFKDAGVYTCHAGLSVADITLTIKPKPGEFPSSEENERNRDPSGKIKYSDSPQSSADHGHRNSSNHNRTRQRNKNVTRNKQRVNDNPANSDGSLHEEEEPLQSHSQMINSDSSSLPTTSSGSRNVPIMPHFEHLLASLQIFWPFQAFSNSRGHQMMMDHHQHQHKYTMDPNNDEREEKDDPFASAKTSEEKLQILDESLSESLDFEYLVTPWSACSQTCGAKGSGYRLRSAHCMVRVKNATQNVDNVLCEDAGLRVPETVEKCGNIECPKWISSAWPPCTKSKCFAWHTALQKRDVNCIFNNESASIACDDNEKPIHQQECYNELCKGIWRVEAWSECNALCDRQGIKYRILQCVWYGTKKPAGNACKDNPRPAVMKKCNGPTCTTDSSDCRDILKYCKNVNKMGLCRLHRFQQQCCETCKFNVN